MQDDGPLLIDDDEPSPRHYNNSNSKNNNVNATGGGGAGGAGGDIALGNLGGAGNDGGNSTDKSSFPSRPSTMSAASSPRRGRNKATFDATASSGAGSGDEVNIPEKSSTRPGGILKNSSSGLMNNWLGKTIFGSFRVGFEDGGTLAEGEEEGEEERGEKEGLLQNSAGSSESVVLEVGGGGGGGATEGGVGLPRPHNTGTVSLCLLLFFPLLFVLYSTSDDNSTQMVRKCDFFCVNRLFV